MKLNENLFEDYDEPTGLTSTAIEGFINYIRDNFNVSSEYIRLLYNLIPYCAEKFGVEKTKELLKETVADSIGMDEEEVDAEFVMEESLNEENSFDNDDPDSEFDGRYDVFSYYSNSVSLLDNFYGLEDDLHTDDFEEVKDWVWEKIQRGLYITVADSKTGNTVSLNPNNYDYDWDDIYRVFDDLEEISPLND